MVTSDVDRYLASLSPRVRDTATWLHDLLIEQGCDAYVKTIYIGYDLGGEMVAALYGHADHVELALALPESFDHPRLIDASHLTWRTLPVAFLASDRSESDDAAELIRTAADAVRNGSHDVNRDADYFMRYRASRAALHEPPSRGHRRHRRS